MGIKILDRLVARAIVEPSIRQQCLDGGRAALLREMGAPQSVLAALTEISSDSWDDFVRKAYGKLLGLRETAEAPVMPSALDGLVRVSAEGTRVA